MSINMPKNSYGPADFDCDDCKSPIHIHALIDSEAWEQIAKDVYALCPLCIDKRLEKAGIKTECDLQFVGKAMSSIRTDRVNRAGPWRPKEYVKLEGVGLPSLYTKKK